MNSHKEEISHSKNEDYIAHGHIQETEEDKNEKQQ